jgi:hypothetical protein
MEPINITLGIFKNRETRSLPTANHPIDYIHTQKLLDKQEENADTPRNKGKLFEICPKMCRGESVSLNISIPKVTST